MTRHADDRIDAVRVLARLHRLLESVDSGLTLPQYRVLAGVDQGGVRSAHLAERLAVRRPTLTAIADGLVAAGYAARESEPGDRRVVRLHATDAGRAALRRADEAYSRRLGPLLDEIAGPTGSSPICSPSATRWTPAGCRRQDSPYPFPRPRPRPLMPREADPYDRPAADPTAGPPERRTRGWLRRDCVAGCCLHYRGAGPARVRRLGGRHDDHRARAARAAPHRRQLDHRAQRAARCRWRRSCVVAALVSRTGLTFMRRYVGGRLALDVQHDLRNEIFGALSRLDGARQDELQTGQIIGRATSDITMVQGLLSMMPIMIGNLLLFVLSLIVMVVLSPLLTLVALAVGPGLLWISIARPQAAVPGHLGRAAAGGRGRRRRRRRGHRRPRGQGLRPGGAGTRQARRGRASGCSPRGCAPPS